VFFEALAKKKAAFKQPCFLNLSKEKQSLFKQKNQQKLSHLSGGKYTISCILT
jgi:hypothetical protein